MYSISKLLPDDYLNGMSKPINGKSNRCTGKTTALALTKISQAMQNPGKVICLFGDEGIRDVMFTRMVIDLITKLSLEHFTIKGNTLQYNIYKTVDEVTVWRRI